MIARRTLLGSLGAFLCAPVGVKGAAPKGRVYRLVFGKGESPGLFKTKRNQILKAMKAGDFLVTVQDLGWEHKMFYTREASSPFYHWYSCTTGFEGRGYFTEKDDFLIQSFAPSSNSTKRA